jgi:hypothetical protein
MARKVKRVDWRKLALDLIHERSQFAPAFHLLCAQSSELVALGRADAERLGRIERVLVDFGIADEEMSRKLQEVWDECTIKAPGKSGELCGELRPSTTNHWCIEVKGHAGDHVWGSVDYYRKPPPRPGETLKEP